MKPNEEQPPIPDPACRHLGAAAASSPLPSPGSIPERPSGLAPADREFLLRLARRTLASLVAGTEPPRLTASGFEGPLAEPRACFVTLTRRGALRGCIGHLEPKVPLWEAVRDNTLNAAERDPRFPPVTVVELPEIRIEISVLTAARPLEHDSPGALLAALRPGVDGVILGRGLHRSTFLPQVWEELPDKVGFLERLSRKGGWEPDAWRDPAMEVWVYEVEAFHETG